MTALAWLSVGLALGIAVGLVLVLWWGITRLFGRWSC